MIADRLINRRRDDAGGADDQGAAQPPYARTRQRLYDDLRSDPAGSPMVMPRSGLMAVYFTGSWSLEVRHLNTVYVIFVA